MTDEERRAYHRQYVAESRAWAKEHKCCTICLKQDARTLIGKHTCFDCLEKRRERERARRASPNGREAAERRNAAVRERTKDRKAAGFCTECGKRKPEPGRASCDKCLQRKRENRKNLREANGKIPRDQWKENGLCVHCGKPLDGAMLAWDVHGRKSSLCSKCYESTVASAALARAAYAKKHGGRIILPPFATTKAAIDNYQNMLRKRSERRAASA